MSRIRAKRVATRFKGVLTRKLHDGDISYDICFRNGARIVWECVGKKSEGYSEKLAEIVRGDRIRSLRHGLELPQRRDTESTFGEMAGAYFKFCETNRRAKGAAEKSRYENHLKGRFGNKRVKDISMSDIDRLRKTLSSKELSPKSIAHTLTTSRTIINFGIKRKMCSDANPFKGIELPKLDNARQRFLTTEEMDRLLSELKERQLQNVYDLALLALHTGCRAGEAFGLRASDVNFSTGFVTYVDTKNSDIRHVPMTAAVRTMLKRRIAAGQGPSALVFRSTKGSEIGEMSHAFKRVCDDLFNEGVEDRRYRVTYHSLRHTFASHLAMGGENVFTIADLLGHRTLAMVKRYSHLSGQHRAKAIERLEKNLQPAKVIEMKKRKRG